MDNNRTVGFYPGTKWHAYQQQMAAAMEKQGYTVGKGDDFTDKALLETSQTIIHFHWIERLWDAPTWFGKIKCLLGCILYLRKAKQLKKTIVWTVHNHLPHQNSNIFDWLGLLVFTTYSDVIACHSKWSKTWLQKFSIRKICPIIVWHGNFDGIYQPIIENLQLKEKYGFKNSYLLLGMVGEIRPNRGHEEAIMAANKVGKDVHLLIAGRCKDESYLEYLREKANHTVNITFIAENLSDEKYNDLIAVSDVTLLPYRSITTSGALLSSWTVGVPTISSDLPYFEELKPKDWRAGTTYKLGNVASLISTISLFLQVDKVVCRQAAKNESDKYIWDNVITPLIVELNKRHVSESLKD